MLSGSWFDVRDGIPGVSGFTVEDSLACMVEIAKPSKRLDSGYSPVTDNGHLIDVSLTSVD